MRILLATVALTGVFMTGACSYQEAICGNGEYPVTTTEGGGTCVKNGEDPPSGYIRYPEGKEPKHVDDEWDLYWRDHRVPATAGTSTGSAPAGR
ncbi:SCO0607 family lipoprotein [Actinoplanes sp. NPDC051494]|uniref:SCO0607 family lipoprotein n=1 Tax=Actinoplanes sp. NPDC051494 TaxID=3363907 RepID=UPI003792B236